MSTGKWDAEGQGQPMPSTGSSISPCDAVCSCLISYTRHSDFFPGSRSSSGSWAPFQTQHSLEPSFENQLSLHSFRCLCRVFPSQLERWEHQDVDGKTHPTRGDLPPREVGSHRRRKKGLTPPCQGAAAPPPSSPMAAALSGAFEAFFLLLPPPTHRRPAQSRSGHAVGWWGPRHGAAASPAPRARCLAPLLAQSWRKREFCPFRQSFSASLRRRAHSLSKSERSCGAGPARQTYSVRGEEGRTQPRTLWELVLETRASRDVARATLVLGGRAGSRLHCLGQEWSRKGAQAPLPPGKAMGWNRA